MRSKFFFSVICVLLLFAVAASSQDGKKEKKLLTNADILLLTQNHFDDETLVKLIQVSETDFDISGEALVDLNNKGVSGPVLRAMLEAAQDKQQKISDSDASAPSSSSPQSSSPAPPAASFGAREAGKATPPASAGMTNPSAATGPMPARQSAAGMGLNPRQFAGMQSGMEMMGLGGMFDGMFSMNNYSAEQLPHVSLLGNQALEEMNKNDDQDHRQRLEYAASTAEIAQTKFKSGAPSPGGMALRSLATQGLSFAAMSAGPAGMMGMSAFSMASGFMPGMRPGAPSMVYVWGLPGRKSARELTNTNPVFELNYGDIPGVDPDAFAPAILRLVQTPDNYRLVGATRTKLNTKSMMSRNGPEEGKWLAEDPWPSQTHKEERGFYVLRPDKPLDPGEYAVVLRPVKGYKATPSGLGGHAQVFYSVWDFSVPGATPEDRKKKK